MVTEKQSHWKPQSCIKIFNLKEQSFENFNAEKLFHDKNTHALEFL